jgi:hypothetical protein
MVGAYPGQGFAALCATAAGRTREAFGDGENEFIVIGMGQTDVWF